MQHTYFQDITENKYYNQYFIGIQQRNSLAKNIGNDSLSMIKSVDDSPGNNHKIKNLNNNGNIPKLERSEKYGGSNNKLSNKNILNKGSSNNLMINNQNYNSNNNSNIEQYSQRNLKDSLDNNDANNNSFKKESNNNINYKVKLPKILKIKFNNINTNNPNINNNIIGNYKNFANIGGVNYDMSKNINNSIDHNNNISYMKGVSMTKKMNLLKSKYVSPYSRKAIFNLPQKFGKQ